MSDTTTETAPEQPDQAQPDPEQPEERTFSQADVDRIIAGRLAKYADYDDIRNQLEETRRQSLSEQERAVEDAKAEARTEAQRESDSRWANRLVKAEFKAAFAGRRSAEEVAKILEPLDLTKFLTEDGDVDGEKVAAYADGVAPVVNNVPPSFDGGPRTSTNPVSMNDLIRRSAGRG